MPSPCDPYIYHDTAAWQQIAVVGWVLVILLCAVIAALLVKRETHG
jgi:hypothetical protein